MIDVATAMLTVISSAVLFYMSPRSKRERRVIRNKTLVNKTIKNRKILNCNATNCVFENCEVVATSNCFYVSCTFLTR